MRKELAAAKEEATRAKEIEAIATAQVRDMSAQHTSYEEECKQLCSLLRLPKEDVQRLMQHQPQGQERPSMLHSCRRHRRRGRRREGLLS